MKIFIKNMVGPRCTQLVKSELAKLDLTYIHIDLGEIVLHKKLSAANMQRLREAFIGSGLEILDDKKSLLVERIKIVVIKMIHYSEELPTENYSSYISKQLNHNYTYLANIFSESQKITIEHFIISHKIEKVKELILNDELNLTGISYKMHYSSVAHLSNQFKKVTGMTPTYFKNKAMRRKNFYDLY